MSESNRRTIANHDITLKYLEQQSGNFSSDSLNKDSNHNQSIATQTQLALSHTQLEIDFMFFNGMNNSLYVIFYKFENEGVNLSSLHNININVPIIFKD